MQHSILIVDDHRIFRQGLKSLLEKEPDLNVAAEADDGRAALETMASNPTELVIMDIAMPSLNGVEATRRIVTTNPRTKVIGLSMHTDRRFVSEMLRAGASGFVTKDSAFEELVQAIRTILSGKVYISPTVADAAVEAAARTNDQTPAPTAYSSLTAREREVLQLIAEGRNTKQIAMDLKLSIKTI